MTYELEAFWRARQESAAACAARFARMLEALAAIHPALARWNEQAMTRAAANKQFCTMPPQIPELTRILEKGRYYKDVPREPIPNLGFSTAAWNGHDDPYGVFFRLSVGAYSDHVEEPNDVFFQLGSPEPGNEDLLNAKVLKRVLLAVAAAWEPDWAIIASYEYTTGLIDSQEHLPRPWAGWITYLAAPYAKKVAPPPTAVVEDTADGGLVMVAVEEQFDIGNPAHVEAADAVHAALKPIQH